MKKLARKNYHSFNSSCLANGLVRKSVIMNIARLMKEEFKSLCSRDHDTLLRDDVQAVKQFSWETVWLELENKIPTLMSLFKQVIRRPEENKPLICVLASMILKKRSPKLGLVQRAITVALYGNGTSKSVCYNYAK